MCPQQHGMPRETPEISGKLRESPVEQNLKIQFIVLFPYTTGLFELLQTGDYRRFPELFAETQLRNFARKSERNMQPIREILRLDRNGAINHYIFQTMLMKRQKNPTTTVINHNKSNTCLSLAPVKSEFCNLLASPT